MISKKNITLVIALGLLVSPTNAEAIKKQHGGLYLADSLKKPISYYRKNMDETYSKYPICLEKIINGNYSDVNVMDCSHILAVINEAKAEKNISFRY